MSETSMTPDEFAAAATERGYSKFQDVLRADGKHYVASYQKRVRKGADTAYFVNHHVYDYSSVAGHRGAGASVSSNTQFHTEDDMDGDAVNVELLDFHSFEKSEAFFEKMWVTMGFGRYKKPGGKVYLF